TRPDLYPPPEEDESAGDETARGPALQQAVYSSPVQRKPAGDEVPAPLPQPVLYFRRESEAPQPRRSVRRSIPGRVMDAHETLRAMLVHAYRWPAEHVQGPF